MVPGPLAPAQGVDPEAHYQLAAEHMSLDPAEDTAAADRLLDLLSERPGDQVLEPETLLPRFRGRPCTILAPGPGGIAEVRAQPAGTPLIVAGSAVARAYQHELHPWLVVTDLDGDAAAHRGFSRRGVPMAVHAHGDNVDLLERLVPALPGPLFGTSQVEPPPAAAGDLRLHRLGGFTDGDRACFLAAALGAHELHLAGWALDPPEGRVDEGKRRKLAIARELLEAVPVPVTGLPDRGPLFP